ncbi:NB-ARC domain-containing protein [Tolypothrix sp. VBCCA 56010]|uniref:WD40 domain-containing protein n=1 Tax=Tolypothrix sp. VBCCA 56010 TaxID=3137731 RepID=UPI003D7E62E7
MRRDVLVVGINQYPFLKDTPTSPAKHLTTPAADAEAIAQLLEEYGDFGVKRLPESVIDGKLQVDPNKIVKAEELEEAIVKLFLPDSDNVPATALLFFAGHGLRKPLGLKQGFLATSDANPSKGQWGMSLGELQNILQKSSVKQQVIWLDCCFSGELLNFKESEIGQQSSGRDRSLIAASHGDEVAFKQLDGQHGILTGAILKALDPDKLQGGEWLSSDKLNVVVREELKKYSQLTKVPQSPLISNHGEIINLIQGKQNFTKIKSNRNDNKNVTNSLLNLDTIEELAEMPPNVSNFFGRAAELDELEQFVLTDKCRLVSLVGMTGIGKTTLAIKFKEKIKNNFKYIIWKNLRLTSSFHVLIDDLVKFFSIHSQAQHSSENINNRIKYLINYFQQNKCLLVLDDVTEIIHDNDGHKVYRKGWEEFGKFIEQIIQNSHQSCLLLTSHKHLLELNNHKIDNRYYRTVLVNGLKVEDVKDAFSPDIYCDATEFEENYWTGLVDYYGGNPVALNIVYRIILDRYNGEISRFFESYIEYRERHSIKQIHVYKDDEYDIILQDLPEGIHNLLGYQFDELDESKKQILYLLAIENEPINHKDIRDSYNLEYLTLINKESSGFNLVPMVRDYVINRLINTIIDEIVKQKPQLFNQCSLLQAHAKDYIKDVQKYRILEPIKKGLLKKFGGNKPVKERLKTILSEWREQEPVEGYLGGNILNLLLLLGTDLTGENFSNIPVWNADLQNAELHDVDFTNSQFYKSTFSETLSCIHSITFSCDGKYFAAGDASGNIRLWEIDSYKLRLFSDVESHNHQVWSVAFSPDGSILASAGEDKTIRLWDVKSQKKLNELNDDQCIYSIKFNLDGNILVSAGDKYIVLWDVDKGVEVQKIDLEQQEVYSIAFSNRHTLVSGSQDGYVCLWDISDINRPQLLKNWKEHEKAVRCVAFCPNGAIIASGSEDGTIRLWKTNINESFKTLKSDQIKQVWTIAFSLNGKTLASGSSDKNPSGIDEHHNIRLWNIDNGECLKILGTYKNGHKNQLRSVAFCPNPENLLISGADDHAIKVWDINTGKCQKTIQGYTNRIWSVAFSPNAKMLVSGSEDNKIRLWNIQEGICNKEPVITLSKHTDWVWSVVFNPDGNMLASASEDNTIRLWRLQNSQWREYANLREQHTDRVRILAFSPDGKKLASGGNDRKIILWDIENREVINDLDESRNGHTNRVLSLAFSPHEPLIASSSRDKTIRLWNYETNAVHVLKGHHNQVHSIAFSPNGNYLISGGFDHKLKLWDIKSKKLIDNFDDHEDRTDRILTVAFHPDGLLFASSGHDKTISLWSLDTKKPLLCLEGHEAAVESLMFSPRGGILVSSSQDQTIKTWNIFTGKCIDTIEPNSKPYQSMKINGVEGLTNAQQATLIALGAIIN